ncbi:MAG: lipopolysaccharide assembly protein LapB, partial [Rubrivivax sp.]|nr:lipopolysaccharide assembly protein LapB [Rubrivivax sp.]
WLLIGLPLAFVLGWLASRADLRQWRGARRDAPRAYFEGLNLLLNEQQDKAIDAFIEAVQLDPDTTELHFALGNLFRRRGEFERAVRVHQHLLSRGDLKTADRERAQRALAQDFAKAGLFDRAEAAWQSLRGTPYDNEAQLALLSLYERSRDWQAAIGVAGALEAAGEASFANRLAHYRCEIALEAEAAGRHDDAQAALDAAHSASPQHPRPLWLAGERAARSGDPVAALAAWDRLREVAPGVFPLLADEYARAAIAAGRQADALTTLQASEAAEPRIELLPALDALDAGQAGARRLSLLARQPSLGAASRVLEVDTAAWQADTRQHLHDAVQRGAQPLQRYRCAACGFDAQQYFWQCPGCQGWDTYPPRRLETL